MEMNEGVEHVRLRFRRDSPASDPQDTPVLIVGQLLNLNRMGYEKIKHKLEPRVSEYVYNLGVESLEPGNSDSVSLYLGLATLATLPTKCSRHNSPARPHALTNVIKASTSGMDETVVVVCEYGDVLASAGAVARAYPLFSRKSHLNQGNAGGRSDLRGNGSPGLQVTVDVEFLLVEPEHQRPGVISFRAVEALATSIRSAARIVDTPCNEMNVQHFLQEVRRVAEEHSLSLTVIEGEELRERGMMGIYSVGRGAEVGPAMAVLSYRGGGPSIAWVGKGIVYDTGGLSLKGKMMMPGMKRDCGGAAAILGAMAVAAKLGVTCDLHAVFCLAENSLGQRSTRPDDIHVLYSGRSVEINNTDAEGRLVLADGVVYAGRDLGASVVVDVATLTGAQGIATGKYHAAALSNSAAWESRAVRAGRVSGDLVFPIPFCPELHFPEFNSAVADMKNSVGVNERVPPAPREDRGNAQSSCAGLFILAHLGFNFPGSWLHIDMASPVHVGERATGYGVTLLTMLFGHYSKDEMIRKVASAALEDDSPRIKAHTPPNF